MAITITKPLYHEEPAPSRGSNQTDDELKFYKSNRWRLTSERHRAHEPFCRLCKAEGRYVLAAVTDHITRIRDGGAKWDESNLQSLCRHHDQVKRSRESKQAKLR